MERTVWLLMSMLLGCVSERAAGPGAQAGLRAPINVLTLATAQRFQAEFAANTPPAPGSFQRRVWAEELERLLRPLRASPFASSLPPSLDGVTVARWEASLDEGWKAVDPDPGIAAARSVIAQAAPVRDGLSALVKTQTEPPEAVAAAIRVSAILVELVQEADLLLLRDSGAIASFEEFVARYPEGPYTASVLFALGALHEDRRELGEAKEAFRRLLARFPAHPLAGQAQQRLAGL